MYICAIYVLHVYMCNMYVQYHLYIYSWFTWPKILRCTPEDANEVARYVLQWHHNFYIDRWLSDSIWSHSNYFNFHSLHKYCICVYMCLCVCMREKVREKLINFKELAHTIVETGKSKIRRVGWQFGDPGKSRYCSLSLKATCWQNSLLLGEHRSLYC